MTIQEKAMTFLVVSEHLRPIHELFCHPAISQFLMADISFNTACKELKIAQIAQLNQLFQPLQLDHIYGNGFY